MKEQCPKCAENGRDRMRDNLHRYPDGTGYCFSCGYLDRVSKSRIYQDEPKATTYYGNLEPVPKQSMGYAWLEQYGLTQQEINQFYQWNNLKQQLVYSCQLTDETECVNIRSFFPGKPKALSYGKKPYQILQRHKDKPIVLVEDLVSAIKVSRHYNAVPLFGTTCPPEALKQLLSVSNLLTVWLDKDALKNALKVRSDAFKQGFSVVHLLRTDLDPKCYTDQEIINYLENGG